MHTYHVNIKLHETDAAGILFFVHQFKLMHDAYENLLEKIGLGFATLLREKNYFLPIVHAESDYRAPLFVGDRIKIEVSLARIGTTSFAFAYQIFSSEDTLVGTGKTVHVTIDKTDRKKIPLPTEMREAIETLADAQTIQDG